MYGKLKKYTTRGFRRIRIDRRSRRRRQKTIKQYFLLFCYYLSITCLCLAVITLFWSFYNFIQRQGDSRIRTDWTTINRIEYKTEESSIRDEDNTRKQREDETNINITRTEDERTTSIHRDFKRKQTRVITETERIDKWVGTKYSRIINLDGTDNRKPYNSIVYQNRETPWQILSCIHLVETNRSIYFNGQSYAGARGNMQFMPLTWQAYCPELTIGNLEHDVQCADRYLQANYKQKNNWYKAIWQYNHELEYTKFVLECSQKLGYDTANPPF